MNARTPIRPRSGSTTRGMSNQRLPRSSCSSGLGHSTASAANESTSTTAAAQPNSHFGIGRSVLPTSPWASTKRCTALGLDRQLGELLLVLLELDLRVARAGRLDHELGRAALLDLLVLIRRVHVDLVGRVGVHGQGERAALLELDLLDAAYGLCVLDVDRDVGACLRAVVAAAAREQDDRDERDHDDGSEDSEPLTC